MESKIKVSFLEIQMAAQVVANAWVALLHEAAVSSNAFRIATLIKPDGGDSEA